ncbi:isochorismatase family protein [Roseomonas nepalensis]|uniref:Isochorismatase family protein n=1 Tax=Muricoccus nepalensis TaxID=1854500 RepID=A0A502FWH7_9PROT|nr:isochorismatase family protein [Roseomonas nepalensis]TPG53632.1 isochorismatase family protein [Roseomonas nepalensis]
MPVLDRERSALLLIDFQARLMPAIESGQDAVANARRLLDVAALLEIPVLFTEQNPAGLGPTMPELGPPGLTVHKMTFDAVRASGFLDRLPPERVLVVAGCEAHVCVLQTVLGLLAESRKVVVVRDALGARRKESKEAALRRMERHGAEIVTTEMVVFEWLATCEHPRFRSVVKLIK